jgi:Carboxypeptidase regulatory-like domain
MKMQKKSLFITSLCVFGHFMINAQTINGLVRDADSGRPIEGAIVVLRAAPKAGPENSRMDTTDRDGVFRFSDLRPGYYECEVLAPDYEELTLTEINVAAGKEQTLDLGLQRFATPLPEFTVRAAAPGRRQQQALAEIPLSREQTLRFPATFFDPARLAMAYPGVANNDDQANGLSIRGHSPAAVRWRLEGVDVVNPNHLTNAGTFNDRPVPSAGGVLMFSAQLLDNSALLTGNFPAGYGDALGGIMDMYLRKGNKRRHEFTAQAGLIGLDLAAEGPLFEKGKNSYLANYRYSTVGLLGQMGISFGGEQIDFQDFSFKLSFSGKKGGEWGVFGLGGLSNNRFAPKKDSADVEQFKDFFKIDYRSRTGILGISNWTTLGSRTSLKSTLILSGQDNTRDAAGPDVAEAFENSEMRVGLASKLLHRLNDRSRLSAGLSLQQYTYSTDLASNRNPILLVDVRYFQTQPWANWEWDNRRTNFSAGLHANIISAGTTAAVLEPRLSATQRLGSRHRMTLAYGLNSQANLPWLYKGADAWGDRETDLTQGLMKAHHLGLRHAFQLGERWALRSELFYQRLFDVPVSATRPDAFSILNFQEGPFRDVLAATGDGENKGIELTAERLLADGWFALVNTTLFDARYRGSDDIWRDTRWNLGRIVNLTGGKEWQRDPKSDRFRAFGLNGRVVWTGGAGRMPVDEAASRVAQTTVFDTRNGFSEQTPDFFRLDLRIYWKRSLGNRRNATFAMDLQNATMQQNTAYRYYDPFTKQVETKKQLGFIPNISWRIEF